VVGWQGRSFGSAFIFGSGFCGFRLRSGFLRFSLDFGWFPVRFCVWFGLVGLLVAVRCSRSFVLIGCSLSSSYIVLVPFYVLVVYVWFVTRSR